jgi:hypothetical protein
MRTSLSTRAALCAVALAASTASADLELKSKGELGLETRAFVNDGDGDDYNVAMVGRLTIDAKLKPFKAKIRGFARHEGIDRERSAFFPEEVWVEYKKNPLRIRVGFQMLNWTATEAFHPADIINSRYFDGNVQSPEKRGELMASVRYKFEGGNVEGYFMPLFSKPILPSSSSRFRFSPLGVKLGDTLVIDESGELTDDQWHPQWALRAQQTFGKIDVAVHAVQHIDRSLPLVLFNQQTGRPDIVFQHLTQVGGTYSQVFGPVIAKLEVGYRRFTDFDGPPLTAMFIPDRDHTLVAAGLEWGFGHDSGGESTLLLEGQSAFGLDDEVAGLLLFQRDLLAGYRFDANDEVGTTFTGSVIVDAEDPEQFFANLEYGRRLGETWTIAAGLRLIRFPPEDPDNPVGPEFLDGANYVYSNLTRFF